MKSSSSICVIGAAGRMGRTIIRCLQDGAVPGIRLSAAVDLKECPEQGSDAGLMAGVSEAGVRVTADLAAAVEEADVVIDFSFAGATASLAPRMACWKRSWVVGTTGLSDEEQAAVQGAADSIPVVMAPNMSLGVNLLLQLVEQAAHMLKGRGYDVEIVERHHRRKKDAPSGTALALGAAAARGLGVTLSDVARHGREGMETVERPPNEIGFHAVRAGDFAGDHTVLFSSDGESIELSHRATSRDAFAVGALRAAAWVVDRPPGLYTMRDVLGV